MPPVAPIPTMLPEASSAFADTTPLLEEKELSRLQGGITRPYDWKGTRIGNWSNDKNKPTHVTYLDSPIIKDHGRAKEFGWSTVRQIPVFCVPENKYLMGYWDPVEDRLFKIRNCMDITGAGCQLALFAPEIDPRLLVRAKAAGLSIDDVLNATSGNLPPYRFSYLIEKAKQHTATVQSFGAALLSAFEKKDVAELDHLRIVHQQNLLKITTRSRELEIDAASDTITGLERQKEAAEYRKEYI